MKQTTLHAQRGKPSVHFNASFGWVNGMPVSWVLQTCIDDGLEFRWSHTKRLIETLYHMWDVEYDTFWNWDIGGSDEN